MSVFGAGDMPSRGDWWKDGGSEPDWSPETDAPIYTDDDRKDDWYKRGDAPPEPNIG